MVTTKRKGNKSQEIKLTPKDLVLMIGKLKEIYTREKLTFMTVMNLSCRLLLSV